MLKCHTSTKRDTLPIHTTICFSKIYVKKKIKHISICSIWHKIIPFTWSSRTDKTNIWQQKSESYCLRVEGEEKKVEKGWIFRGDGSVLYLVWGDIGVYNFQNLPK